MQNICPHCHSPIPADAPGGLCPACVLLGVAGPTNPSQFSAAATPTLEEIAAAFPELEILEMIGQGGMGVVFKARQPRLDRLVALKLLPPTLAAQPGFAERFTREARVLARLAHPHIVGIYDFGESAGFFYLIMEFVNGVNLRAAMRAGVKPEQALLLVPKICEALQFAHDHGVLHRDIKPENILLDTTGTPKLADFGIAKLAGEEALRTGLTASGATLGTAVYMAPEQVEKPATVDHRADIYSLGVVLYEMLTGELPLGRFGAPSEKSTVNRGVDDVVMRALEKERERRQQSATAMKTEVEHATLRNAPPVAPQSSFGMGDPRITKILGILCALSAIGIPIMGILRTSAPSPGNMLAFTILFGALAGLAKLFEPATVARLFPNRATFNPAWNPWPRRVFMLIAALILVPAVLIALGLIVPMFAERTQPAPVATEAQWDTQVDPNRPVKIWKESRKPVAPADAAFAPSPIESGTFPPTVSLPNPNNAQPTPRTQPLPALPKGAPPWTQPPIENRTAPLPVRPPTPSLEMPAPLVEPINPLPLAPSPGVSLPAPAEAARMAKADDAAQRDVAAMQGDAIRLAFERLNIAKAQVESGTAPTIVLKAAERDLAIAEARGDAVRIGEVQVAYEEARCLILKANAQANTVSASDLLEGELALNNARLQLEIARRKSRDARGPVSELPAPAQPSPR